MEHPTETTEHKKFSHFDYRVHMHRPGGGEEQCAEGHLPYALRVRPQTKASQCKQDSQPARLREGEGSAL